jgi:hypothetical protein
MDTLRDDVMRDRAKMLSGGEDVGMYPANDHLLVELTPYAKAILAGEFKKAQLIKEGKDPEVKSALFLGDALDKEKAKDVVGEISFRVLAVPLEYVYNKERAKCLPNEFVILHEKAMVEQITLNGVVYGLVPARYVILVTAQDLTSN